MMPTRKSNAELQWPATLMCVNNERKENPNQVSAQISDE